MTPPFPTYRRFLVNVLASAGGRVAAIGLALVLATLLVRTLGTARYGTWSFFFVLIGYWSLLDFGLSVAVERSVARAAAFGHRTTIERILNVALTAVVAISALAQAAVWFVPDPWLDRLGDRQEVRRCLTILPLCLLFSNAGAVCGAGLSGLQQMASLNALRTAIGVLTTMAVIGLVLAGFDRLDLLLLTSATGLLAAGIVSWRLMQRTLDGPLRLRVPSVDRQIGGELLSLGGSVQAMTLAAQLGDQALRILLAAHFGADAMGAYDLAFRGAMGLRSLAASLVTTLVPFTVGEHLRGGHQALAQLHGRALRYLSLFMIAGTAAAFAASRDLITLWLGPVGIEAGVLELFRLLLIAHGLQTLAGPTFAIGRALNLTRSELIISLLGNGAGVALAAVYATPLTAVAGFITALTAATVGGAMWLQRLLDLTVTRTTAALLLIVMLLTGGVAWLTIAAVTPLVAGALWRIVIVSAATCLTAAGLAWMTGLVRPDEQQAWRRLVTPGGRAGDR